MSRWERTLQAQEGTAHRRIPSYGEQHIPGNKLLPNLGVPELTVWYDYRNGSRPSSLTSKLEFPANHKDQLLYEVWLDNIVLTLASPAWNTVYLDIEGLPLDNMLCHGMQETGVKLLPVATGQTSTNYYHPLTQPMLLAQSFPGAIQIQPLLFKHCYSDTEKTTELTVNTLSLRLRLKYLNWWY